MCVRLMMQIENIDYFLTYTQKLTKVLKQPSLQIVELVYDCKYNLLPMLSVSIKDEILHTVDKWNFLQY